jgi:hypothetical protein
MTSRLQVLIVPQRSCPLIADRGSQHVIKEVAPGSADLVRDIDPDTKVLRCKSLAP